ncbi:flagellin N-terminal helical domain-containing protein [Candidatus Magnetomonas plexicatena]|uniref:flagellin N-terminal helical domain-containing protein n=1 Tax=Candidatus Magnetomonas plexicatena TaxID=2552947 RepID=UPI001C755D35|nr:flagellin FliC [Nitrospirales bacterium LBB_01]
MAGLTINTNMMSINGQRNLRKTMLPLSETMKRLSSGLRINSSKDDAAGLAIVTRQETQIRGLTIGVRNASDGLSMAETAEGAMDEITQNLQRIRELAVQAMSGQYGVTDISYMQNEVDALTEEIGRIAEQTKFNDTKLLSGTFRSRIYASYAASDPSISVVIDSLNTDSLHGKTFGPGGKDGPIMFLKDIHTASGTAYTPGISNRSFTGNNTPFPPNWSDIASSTIAYTGIAALRVADPTTVDGYISQASNTIAVVDGALNVVIAEKAKMGAKQNQFEATVRNLDTVIETTMASKSRILDADYAVETAALTKYMILQQAGISVLAQANTIPQNVLKLLQ